MSRVDGSLAGDLRKHGKAVPLSFDRGAFLLGRAMVVFATATRASWKQDKIHLPDEAVFDQLPTNPPTGG